MIHHLAGHRDPLQQFLNVALHPFSSWLHHPYLAMQLTVAQISTVGMMIAATLSSVATVGESLPLELLMMAGHHQPLNPEDLLLRQFSLKKIILSIISESQSIHRPSHETDQTAVDVETALKPKKASPSGSGRSHPKNGPEDNPIGQGLDLVALIQPNGTADLHYNKLSWSTLTDLSLSSPSEDSLKDFPSTGPTMMNYPVSNSHPAHSPLSFPIHTPTIGLSPSNSTDRDFLYPSIDKTSRHRLNTQVINSHDFKPSSKPRRHLRNRRSFVQFFRASFHQLSAFLHNCDISSVHRVLLPLYLCGRGTGSEGGGSPTTMEFSGKFIKKMKKFRMSVVHSVQSGTKTIGTYLTLGWTGCMTGTERVLLYILSLQRCEVNAGGYQSYLGLLTQDSLMRFIWSNSSTPGPGRTVSSTHLFSSHYPDGHDHPENDNDDPNSSILSLKNLEELKSDEFLKWVSQDIKTCKLFPKELLLEILYINDLQVQSDCSSTLWGKMMKLAGHVFSTWGVYRFINGMWHVMSYFTADFENDNRFHNGMSANSEYLDIVTRVMSYATYLFGDMIHPHTWMPVLSFLFIGTMALLYVRCFVTTTQQLAKLGFVFTSSTEIFTISLTYITGSYFLACILLLRNQLPVSLRIGVTKVMGDSVPYDFYLWLFDVIFTMGFVMAIIFMWFDISKRHHVKYLVERDAHKS